MDELDEIVDFLFQEILIIIPDSKKSLNDYWKIGKIMTKLDERNIKDTYQIGILLELSERLNRKFSKGFSFENLIIMKCLYSDFPSYLSSDMCFNWSSYKKEKLNFRFNFFEMKKYKSLMVSREVNEIKKLFCKVNHSFLLREQGSILSDVAERSLCGRMMYYFQEEINSSEFKGYYVDVEYNRNDGKLKTIMDDNFKIIPITCDLIIHSRGENISCDNLVALEMKKSTALVEEKIKDKERLKILTKDRFDNIWSYDGETLPEHVCRYLLGIYYEININNREILIEYYAKGTCFQNYKINF